MTSTYKLGDPYSLTLPTLLFYSMTTALFLNFLFFFFFFVSIQNCLSSSTTTNKIKHYLYVAQSLPLFLKKITHSSRHSIFSLETCKSHSLSPSLIIIISNSSRHSIFSLQTCKSHSFSLSYYHYIKHSLYIPLSLFHYWCKCFTFLKKKIYVNL